MLKRKSKILLLIFLITILISSVCFATDEVTTLSEENADEVSEEISEEDNDDSEPSWVNDDLYISKDDIVIDGVVDGNVFAIGKNVTITGEVGGDVFVMAENVTIEGGYIYSSLFTMSKNLKINGIVYDVYAVCSDFSIEENGFIYRDLRLTSLNVAINGPIRRNAYINSSNITFSDYANTYINGNLTYSAQAEITIPEGAVNGSVNFNKAEDNKEGFNFLGKLSSLLMLLVNTVVITLLAIWLTPNFVKKVSNTGIKKALISLPVGLAGVIALFVMFFVLLFTGIGTTVAFALFSLTCLLLAFSTVFTSMVISGFVTKKFKLEGNLKFVLIALAATLVLWALELIPFVGTVVAIISVFFGFGTVIFNLFTKVPEEVKEVKE